jgi:hypothetical protein
MAKDKKDKKPPREVRSPIQVVVRVVLALLMLALLIGFGVALVRLLSRPAAASTPGVSAAYAELLPAAQDRASAASLTLGGPRTRL